MNTIISLLTGDFAGYIIAAGGAVVALLVAFFKGRSGGRKAERSKWQDREQKIEAEARSKKSKADRIARKRPSKSKLNEKLEKGDF